VQLFGGEKPVSNKNHFLRWEGDTEFFGWLVRCGVQFDANKGVSKTGETGFNFGFCHPYYPVDPKGEMIDVLEVSTLSQDIGIFAPPEVVEPTLNAVTKVHGVMHFVFHPAHIPKPGVEENLLSLISKARVLGMEWWTGRRINDWERARRSAIWSDCSNGRVRLTTRAPLREATILWLSPDPAGVTVNGKEIEPQTVERWGFRFQSVALDLEPGQDCALTYGEQGRPSTPSNSLKT
jgi:hypothetical protein